MMVSEKGAGYTGPGKKEEEVMRTIRITGKGQIEVHPDMTRITITLEETYREYSDTMHHSAADTEKIGRTSCRERV